MATNNNDFLGENPFPKNDSRHSYWIKANRYAMEEFEQLKANILSRYPSEPENEPGKFCSLLAEMVYGRFDIYIKHLARLFISNYQSVEYWENAARKLMDTHLSLVRNINLTFIPPGELESETKIHLLRCLSHRKAEAFKLARQSEQNKILDEEYQKLEEDPDFQRRLREGQEAIARSRKARGKSNQDITNTYNAVADKLSRKKDLKTHKGPRKATLERCRLIGTCNKTGRDLCSYLTKVRMPLPSKRLREIYKGDWVAWFNADDEAVYKQISRDRITFQRLPKNPA